MSTPLYTITKDEDTGLSTATLIFADGSTRAINSTNAHFADLVQAVVIDGADEADIIELLTPALTVGKSLRALSERVRYDEGNIYFDGDVIDDALGKHIVRVIEEGADDNKWRALVNFMEKLRTNPSEKSIASLYEFLTRQNFTILPDGDFLAYKGLNRNGTSIHAGYGIVDGVAFKSAHLKNEIGSTVEIPRSKVDPDTARGCSTGLHAGSYAYAKGFAQGMLVTVKINPRDVVSVPDDCHFQKIRTARYVVLAQTELEDTRTTWASEDEDNDWEDDEDFEDEENEERDETLSELEDFRDRTDDRDFEAEPLTQDEAELLDEASEYTELDSEEEAALDAYYATQREQLAQTEPVKSNLDTGLSQSAAGDTVDGGDFTQYLDPKPTAAEFADQLRTEIEGEESITLTFDYTRGDGSKTSVKGFTPADVDERGRDLLVTGKNADDQWRSYYYSQMENLSISHDDTERTAS